LVVSVFVHVAIDEATLYVEWTPCLLLPIKWEYQAIDGLSPSLWTPLSQAALDLVIFPARLPGRLARLISVIRPLPNAPGVLDARRYGSLVSLRELAEDEHVHNYFQRADVERYTKILRSRFISAVSQTMRDHGFSSAAFDLQATTVITNNVSFNGNANAPMVIGSHVGGNVSGGGTFNPGGAQPGGQAGARPTLS
jgi:hypothetical protein